MRKIINYSSKYRVKVTYKKGDNQYHIQIEKKSWIFWRKVPGKYLLLIESIQEFSYKNGKIPNNLHVLSLSFGESEIYHKGTLDIKSRSFEFVNEYLNYIEDLRKSEGRVFRNITTA